MAHKGRKRGEEERKGGTKGEEEEGRRRIQTSERGLQFTEKM